MYDTNETIKTKVQSIRNGMYDVTTDFIACLYDACVL